MTDVSASLSPRAVPTNPYLSDCPEGFDTVVGYLSKTQPGIFRTIDEPVLSTYRDNIWLTMQSHVRGLETISVPAPAIVSMIGFDTIRAYPVDLLRERLD